MRWTPWWRRLPKAAARPEAIVLDVSKSDDVTKVADQILKASYGRNRSFWSTAPGINVAEAQLGRHGTGKAGIAWSRSISTACCIACAAVLAGDAGRNRTAASSTSHPGPAVHVSKMPGPAYTTIPKHAVLALTPFVQHG